jgi:TonB family protein
VKTHTMVLGAPPYGAAELKRVLQKYLTIAVAIAAGLHFLLIGAYYLAENFSGGETKRPVPLRPPLGSTTGGTTVIPQPPIDNWIVVTSPGRTGGGAANSVLANPVPVADDQVDPKIVFASQDDTYRGGPGDGTGEGAYVYVPDTLEIEIEPRPFIIVEREPIPVKRVNPVYPEVARAAGLTGKVVANLWIDKKGKVHEVRIMESTSEMFNQAVIDAASRYVFEPAMMNQGPVAVWVAVPFVFKLN